ncbi:MAG: hypothetical protein ACRDF4_11325, partial [Rhabdochlamydiaceae bacterium]
VKLEMKKRRSVNWSSDIRNFIESKIETAEFRETLKKIEVRAKGRKTSMDSTMIVRAARDSR